MVTYLWGIYVSTVVTTLWDRHYQVAPVQDTDNTTDVDSCMCHRGVGAWQTVYYNTVLYVRGQPYRCWGMTDSIVQHCVVCQRAATQHFLAYNLLVQWEDAAVSYQNAGFATAKRRKISFCWYFSPHLLRCAHDIHSAHTPNTTAQHSDHPNFIYPILIFWGRGWHCMYTALDFTTPSWSPTPRCKQVSANLDRDIKRNNSSFLCSLMCSGCFP
jgi:hypothetical protein